MSDFAIPIQIHKKFRNYCNVGLFEEQCVLKQWKRGKVSCDFSLVKHNWAILAIPTVGTQKICEISWAIIKNLWNENSACQLTKNSKAIWNFYWKREKNSYMDIWEIWENPYKDQFQTTFRWFVEDIA